MTQFIVTDAAGVVDHVMGRPDPPGFEGVVDLTPFPRNGWIYRAWQGEVVLAAPTPGSVHRWLDAEPRWIVPLDEARAVAIQQIDAAGEALRLAVVNRMTMQTEEYRRVEAQARTWCEAGYPEEEGGAGAPRGVRGWAMAKWRDGWTNRQAADDILTTADEWMHILDEIRDLRLANKEDVRHAGAVGEIAAITADMRTDMRAMAQQLGLLEQYTTSVIFKEV